MEKLRKTAKILDIVFLTLFWSMGVSCLVSFAFCGQAWSSPPLIRSLCILDYCNISTCMTEAELAACDLTIPWFLYCLELLLVGISVCYAYWRIHKILYPLRYGEPFALSVSRDFRRLGWLSLVANILSLLLNTGMKYLASQAVAVPGQLIARSRIHGLNVYILIVPAFLFLFSYIFEYGEELQTLSDETL